MWDAAKARGEHPADRPEFNALAAMRDLTIGLVGHVEQVQEHLGDYPDDEWGPRPGSPPVT